VVKIFENLQLKIFSVILKNSLVEADNFDISQPFIMINHHHLLLRINAAHIKEHTYKVQQYKNITKKHETVRIEMFMKHEEEETHL